jgi:large subunit ribosomal protein L25
MDFAKVNVEIRKETGKGSARRSRAAGRVPAVLYGRREDALPLSVDPLTLQRSMDKERKRNTVFSLAVTGDGQAPQEITAMLREVQIDPLSRQVLHIDFLRISLDEEVRVTVPLSLVGTPKGVIDGGNLHQSVHMLAVAAKPTAIPTKIELDVSGLSIGEALHVSDLKLAAGVRALLEAKEALASVVAPKAEKEAEVAAEAAPAEGAAAPAAGAAAGKEGKEGDAAAPAAGGKAAAGAKAGGDKGGDKKGK